MEFEHTKLSLIQSQHTTQDVEKYLLAIFNNTGDPIFIKDEHFKFVLVNDACCRFFGMPEDQIIGSTLAEKFPDQEIEGFFAIDKKVLKEGKEILCEETVTPKGAKPKRVLTRKNRFIDHNGKYFIVGVVHDITQRQQIEEKLKRAASVFTHAHEGIMITDASAKITEVNESFSRITGYSAEEVQGRNPRIFQSGRHPPEFYAAMWGQLVAKGYWDGEIWNRRKNGEIYPLMLTISAVKSKEGVIQHYVSLYSDITSIKEYQHQLEHSAHFDLLTNLPNRVLLADRLSQAMLQCRRHQLSLAVVFIDLDGFKQINDNHGHAIGDELLIAISDRMKKALREGDNLARIGGDEFVAVLTDLTSTESAEPVLKRLLLAASKPVTVNGLMLQVSASIGVTFYPQDDVDADQLMRHADQAMYAAKRAGKNRYYFFDTAQDDAIREQQDSLDAIRRGIERDEFVLYYQPKVNMREGKVIGVEALIRWQHPQRGLLEPLEFMPIIENNCLSVKMGEVVIDKALTQISRWQKIGLNLPISTSVNIGAMQLQQPSFIKNLARLLAAHPDVEPSNLQLEIRETSALYDVNHISGVMNGCMALGVNFALDDFGTGYSPLIYLRKLPASIIKIDKSFVKNMLSDMEDLAIVEGVIALAKLCKRDVIAEGVETIPHGTTLMELGCDLAQGFGIARPMPAADIPAWLSNWKADESWQTVT